jgi:hypothetical protein
MMAELMINDRPFPSVNAIFLIVNTIAQVEG